MSDAENNQSDNGAASRSLALEFYKTTLEHRSKIISIIFVSGIAVAIPAAVDAYKARMDYLSKETSLQLQRESFQMESELKEKDQNLKELTFRQESIQSFSSTGLQQDIELRIRLAEYFSALADPDYQPKWQLYLKSLSEKRDKAKLSLDKANDDIDIEESKENPDQLHLRKLYRAKGWLEAEFNPIAVNQPATLRPAVPQGTTNAGLTQVGGAKLLELFGSPVTDANSLKPGCNEATNPVLGKQLKIEELPIGKVTLLGPALESLKEVTASITTMSSAIAADMKVAGSLCVRTVRGGTRFSSHSYGLAVDIILGGSFNLSDDQKTTMQLIAGEFHKQGWIWGGGFKTFPDYPHFEVGQELLQRWIDAGALEASASVTTDPDETSDRP